jgi:hypothetical protein
MTHTELENLWEPALLTDAVSGTLRFGDLRVAARGGELQVMTLRDSWALA